MLNSKEKKQYSKQIQLSEIGIDGQQKLKNSKVLVVGAGGLGCPVLIQLTSSGVGEIGLIDDFGEMKSTLNQRFGENIKIREFAPKKKLFAFSNLFSGAVDILINKIEERINFKRFGL